MSDTRNENDVEPEVVDGVGQAAETARALGRAPDGPVQARIKTEHEKTADNYRRVIRGDKGRAIARGQEPWSEEADARRDMDENQ